MSIETSNRTRRRPRSAQQACLAIVVISAILSLGAARPDEAPHTKSAASLPVSTLRPIVVRVVREPPDAAERAQAQRAQAAQQDNNRWMLVLTGALAVFAALQVVVTALTLQGLRHSRRSADAAHVAAAAAKLQAEIAERALIGVQRPFLRVMVEGLEVRPPQPNMPYEEFVATVVLENRGREPAILVDGAAQFRPCIGGIDPPTPGADDFQRIWSIVEVQAGDVVEPNQKYTFEVSRLMDAEKGETLDNFYGLRGALFLYGIVVYDDLIGMRRELGFTFGWLRDDDGGQGSFFRCGLEGRNYDRLIEPQGAPIRLEPLEASQQPSTPDAA